MGRFSYFGKMGLTNPGHIHHDVAHCKSTIGRVSDDHTEALRLHKSESDPGHIFRRENALQKNCQKKADVEHSGGGAIEDSGR